MIERLVTRRQVWT